MSDSWVFYRDPHKLLNFIIIIWMSSPGTLGWVDFRECHASKPILKFSFYLKKKSVYILFYSCLVFQLFGSVVTEYFIFKWWGTSCSIQLLNCFCLLSIDQTHLWLSQGTNVHCHSVNVHSGISKNHWQWYLHNITESNFFAKIKLFSVSSVMQEVPDTCKWMQNLLLTFASKTIWNNILCVGRCQSVKYCEELDMVELFHEEPNNGENDSRYDK